MDPNAALAALRQAIADYHQAGAGEDALVAADAVAEQFEALDQWLTKGGFPPNVWLH